MYRNSDRKALWSIYTEIYGQLHAESLSENNTKSVESQTYTECGSTSATAIDKEQKVNSLTEDHIKSTIPDCLKLIFESEAFKKSLNSEDQSWFKKKTLALWEGNLDKKFISSLENLKKAPDCPNKTKEKWGNCIKILKNLWKKAKEEEIKQPNPMLSPEQFPVGQFFYNDPNIWNHIEPLISTEEKKEVGNQIKWIKKVYKDGGYKKRSGEWVPCNDKSNESVIKHFYNNNKNNNGINRTTLEKIIIKLKEIYKVN